MVPDIQASIIFEYPGSLDEVARELSKAIFGDLPFVGREKNIRDEIPAVFIDSELLGFDIVLMQDGEHEFHLEISPSVETHSVSSDVCAHFEFWISLLMVRINNVSVVQRSLDLLS